MKVPVSFRERVRSIAKETDKNMMQVLIDSIEAGATAAKQVSPATTPIKEGNS